MAGWPSPESVPACHLHLGPLALSSCTSALLLLPLHPALGKSKPTFSWQDNTYLDLLGAKLPAPEVTPDELPNDQGCGYNHVSAEGYGFTWELNYSSAVEEGRERGDSRQMTRQPLGPGHPCRLT